jgi:hypothetical protein
MTKVAAATPKNTLPLWKVRSTVVAVTSRLPVVFHEPKVSLNDSPRTPPPVNWMDKTARRLPSRPICSTCAPSSWTARYVPAILSPRPSTEAGPPCPRMEGELSAIAATTARDADHLWMLFIGPPRLKRYLLTAMRNPPGADRRHDSVQVTWLT